MLQGGGKLFAGSSGRHIGPGHFGLLDLGDGVQKFSCHYEADLDRGGISVLDIRPLLWRDGWPVAGDNVTAGTYEIESARTGTALEMAVQGVPVGGARGRGGARPRRSRPAGRGDAPPPTPPPPDSARRTRRRSAANWPAGRSTPAWRPTCCRRSRSGRSRPSTTPAAILGRLISRSPSPAPTARLPQPRTPSSRSCPRSPADPNNSGASIS